MGLDLFPDVASVEKTVSATERVTFEHALQWRITIKNNSPYSGDQLSTG